MLGRMGAEKFERIFAHPHIIPNIQQGMCIVSVCKELVICLTLIVFSPETDSKFANKFLRPVSILSFRLHWLNTESHPWFLSHKATGVIFQLFCSGDPFSTDRVYFICLFIYRLSMIYNWEQ